MPTDARRRLLQAAEKLFYAEGVSAVGVERLLECSGVGRASFYRHFESKDDLVTTFVRSYGEQWRAWLSACLAARPDDPLAVFDGLARRIEGSAFRGCAAINTMVEVADPTDPAFRAAAEHKRAVVEILREALERAGHEPAAELAEEFQLLIDGVAVVTMRERSAVPARRAEALARARLDAASRGRTT